MYYQTKISNGIRLLIVPAKNTKAITVLILVPTGSRYESISLNGASHFIEHMMFKGTKQRPNNLAIAKELDSIGAEYNAFTGKEYTGYWIKTVKEKINTAFDVLSDMLFNSVFNEHDFIKEKGVILEEIKMYQENPLLYIDEFFENVLYKNHPLGRLISGSMSTVKHMSLTNLLNYKDRFYNPNQMIIAVSGNIKKAEAVSYVIKYFGSKKGLNIKNKYSAFTRSHIFKKNKVSIIFKQIDQVQLALGGFAYPYGHNNMEVLILLLIILGGNMSSRLFNEIRVKRGLAYFVKADMSPYKDTGGYVIRAGIDKENTQEALKVILNELKKIRKNKVSSEELRRAKDYFNGTLKLSLEDSASLIGWYAKQLLLTNKIISPQEKLKKIKKVTAEDIQKTAELLFYKQKLSLSLIGPFKNKKVFLRILNKKV